MTTLEKIRNEHQEAEKTILAILREVGEPRSARELVEIAYRDGLAFSADTLRLATWTLIEKGQIDFTPDRRLQLTRFDH